MPRSKSGWVWVWWMVLLGLAMPVARAATPRWVTGPPYFTAWAGQPVIWYTDTPQYFTDPGDLSVYVSHAAADAMVAAAASVWNVPTSRIVLAQGGTLDEQVSNQNVYVDGNGLVFPADVASANGAAKQIAVVYDRDGSVTDLLLGAGASDPSGCRQNGVTESVDSITPDGYIRHAVVILNGRCTGPAQEEQLQMQYQLERVFGRVLGLGWSQANDNVFTGSPQPTALQMMHWPIMHPIDVICGPYTYQCLQQPFTLRDDDIASITALYPVSVASNGKVLSLSAAAEYQSVLTFPGGEGMAGVNVVARRAAAGAPEDSFDDVTAVTGVQMQRQGGNPVTPQGTNVPSSMGTPWSVGVNWAPVGAAGMVDLPWIPLPADASMMVVVLHTEPINPLYTGAYAVGPYQSSVVAPSGSSVSWTRLWFTPGTVWSYSSDSTQTPGGATATCSPGGGTESAPVTAASGGWWTGTLCGQSAENPYSYTHSDWVTLPVLAHRTFTVEATALDELGAATTAKARPVIGVWSAEDAPGATADVAAPAAFNGTTTGTTSVGVQMGAAGDAVRIAIGQENGDGRPDYSYRGRVLYAATVSPAAATSGATITIAGMGFRAGNTVTIGGVPAKVTSWTDSAIVATVPRLSTVQPGQTASEDIMVQDTTTGGSTVMSGALAYSYTAPQYTVQMTSGPSGNVPESLPASPAFAVKVLDVDGVTPLSGVPVAFSTTAGNVQWSACGAATCTVTTGADGVASVVATPQSQGSVTLQATVMSAVVTDTFTVVPLVRLVTVTPGTVYLAAGATANWPVSASVLQMGLPAILTPVVWMVQGTVNLLLSNLGLLTDSNGTAGATVTAGPLTGGATVTGQACAWGIICGGFSAVGVDPSQFAVRAASGAGQSVGASEMLQPVRVTVTDQAGNPVVGAAVTVHQVVRQWTAPCPAAGRCPESPIYQQGTTTATTDIEGQVTVNPLQQSGPEVTEIVVTSGTEGSVSLSLEKHP